MLHFEKWKNRISLFCRCSLFTDITVSTKFFILIWIENDVLKWDYYRLYWYTPILIQFLHLYIVEYQHFHNILVASDNNYCLLYCLLLEDVLKYILYSLHAIFSQLVNSPCVFHIIFKKSANRIVLMICGLNISLSDCLLFEDVL